MLSTILNVVNKVIPVVGTIIGVVEQIYGGGAGASKKMAYMDGVVGALQQYFPTELLRDPEFLKKLGRLADLIIEIANYIYDKEKK